MRSKHCITCEANKVSRKKKAKHFVTKGEIEWGFCDEHYQEYLVEEEYSINLIESEYGDYDTES